MQIKLQESNISRCENGFFGYKRHMVQEFTSSSAAELSAGVASSLQVIGFSCQTDRAYRNSNTNSPEVRLFKASMDSGKYQGVLRTITHHKTLGMASVLSGGIRGMTVNKSSDEGLSCAGRSLDLRREFKELKIESERKRERFSPLCCALLLGFIPGALSAVITENNGTMVNVGSTNTFLNLGNGSNVTTIINQGTLDGTIEKWQQANGTLTLINQNGGTILSIIGNNHNGGGGLFSIDNQLGGIMSMGRHIDSYSGTLVINNSGTLTTARDYHTEIVRAFTGSVSIVNNSTGWIGKRIMSYTNNGARASLYVTNNGGTIAKEIYHRSSGEAVVTNTGSISGVVVDTQHRNGTATIYSNGGTIGSISNMNTSTTGIIHSAGTITTIVNSGKGFNLTSTGGGLYLRLPIAEQ